MLYQIIKHYLLIIKQRHFRYSLETPTFYQNYLTIRNTADVKSGKPIAFWLESISSGDAVNTLVAFYDIYANVVTTTNVKPAAHRCCCTLVVVTSQ
jgi:hypothetical protein